MLPNIKSTYTKEEVMVIKKKYIFPKIGLYLNQLVIDGKTDLNSVTLSKEQPIQSQKTTYQKYYGKQKQ